MMLSLRNITSILLIALFGLHGIELSGQEILRYTGEFRTASYTGEADFNYRIEENDTILDGPFQFQRSNLEALIQQEDQAFNFNGSFNNNVAEGSWSFLFGDYQTDSKTELVDNQYRVSISGVQHQAAGELRGGKLHGNWNYQVDRLERSVEVARLFASSIEYDSGIPQKNFKIENNFYTLVGRCLRNGLAHDEWTLFSNDGDGTSENWIFNNGLLKLIETETDGLKETYEFFDTTPGREITIALDEAYLTLLQLKQKLRRPDRSFPVNLNSLLSENETYYRKIDRILSDLGESDLSPGFRVVVEHFPLDSLETDRLDSISTLYNRSRTVSRSLLEDTQLNILKLSDQQAAYLYSALVAMDKEFLGPIGKLVTYRDQGILEYLSREEIFQILWPEGFPDTEISVQTGEGSGPGTFSGPQAERFNFEAQNIESAYQMAQYMALSLDSVQGVLGEKLTLEKRQQDLVQLEEKLIANSDRIKVRADSLGPNSSANARKALERIKEITAKQLSIYSGIEDNEAQLDFGTELLGCYESLEQLVSAIGALPTQTEEIKKVYEDAVWNPFMAVIMTEEVKKRITAAYRKYVIPHLLNRVETGLQCENAGELNELFKNVYQRMLEMRDEDTSRLERKLKREQDPVEILDLFNVEPRQKEAE